MSTFQEILKKEGSQEAQLAQLKETWKSTADDKKSEMLHAKNDHAFRVACEKGYLETAKWLRDLCKTPEEQSAMLHAEDNFAFRWACQEGHLKLAKWLWTICPKQEQSAMLHAQDDFAFCVACQNGHSKIVEWLWTICPDQEQKLMLHAQDDFAFCVAWVRGHQKIAKWLWAICPQGEESAMLHGKDDFAFRVACEKGHLETAKWLRGLCKTPEEQLAMLHAQDDNTFIVACELGHLKVAEWLWAICPQGEQSAMLHGRDDLAFRLACQEGYLKLVKWLWTICPEQEQSAMLHAKNDAAFRVACEIGHLETAKWLRGLCKTPEEQLAMLHAKDNGAFLLACKNGHLETAEWVFSLHKNDLDIRLKLFNKAMIIKDGIAYVLWPCLQPIEQDEILNQGLVQDQLKKAIENNDAKFFNSLLQLVDDCHVSVKQQYNVSLFRFNFVTFTHDLLSSSFHQAMYLEYIKGCKAYNRQYFREHQMNYLLRSAIRAKDHGKINMVLSALDAEDLLASASLLEGWLSLVTQEGVTDFVTCYQKALWCDELYPLLEQGHEHINDGMITIIRTLFETKTCDMTSLISVINQHASDPQYWPSICQQVIIDMIKTKGLNEDTKALFESLCQHALAPENYFSEEEYHEMKLQLMSWYKEEAQRADQGKGLWKDQQTLSQMYGRLGIGLGITTNLATGKVAIDQNLTALDQNLTSNPRSVAEFPGFSDGSNINGGTKRGERRAKSR